MSLNNTYIKLKRNTEAVDIFFYSRDRNGLTSFRGVGQKNTSVWNDELIIFVSSSAVEWFIVSIGSTRQ